MDKDYVTRLIYEYNPQWEGKLKTSEFKRDIYSEIKKFIGKKQILAVTGLRRVGKTTLMKQLINELPPRQCLFFSFDERETQSKDTLIYVIDYFMGVLGGRYVFLDEIHYVEDWQGVLKRYYDTKGVKFVISGSASIELKKARESLAGRIIDFYLPPLSFNEYLKLSGGAEKGVSDLEKEIESAGICLDNLPDNFEKLKVVYDRFSKEKEYFEHKFKEYVYKGAFPEIVHEEDDDFIRRYINDIVVKRILLSDIPSLFEIKRGDMLYDLFRYVAKESGNLFEIKNLCSIFNADYNTASNYLSYLENSFLVKVSQTYSKSFAARIRKNKKIYVSHPSLAFAALGYSREVLGIEQVMGGYVEGLFAGKFFWRSKNKNEVDAVFETDSGPIPVEVKYRKYAKAESGMQEFMKRFGPVHGIVATKETFKVGKIAVNGRENKLMYVPVWFLMMCARI